MESFDVQSDLNMIDNIEFEEKVDIKKIVLIAEPTKIPKIEFADNENEQLESAESIHEERNNFSFKMEENISKLCEELDKEKYENRVMGFSLRRSLKIRQFVKRMKNYDISDSQIQELKKANNQMSTENTTLKARISEMSEEFKTILLLNAKNTNTIIKMHEKSLDDKTNELVNIKKELQSVKKTNHELLHKVQELEMNNSTFVNNVCLEKKVHEVRDHVKIHESILEGEDVTTIKIYDKEAETDGPVNTGNKRKLMKTNTKHERGKYVGSSEFGTILENSDGSRKSKFGCDICKIFFTLKHHLKRHISNVHEGKKPFKCESCDYTFAAKQTLDRHISSVHEKYVFPCSTCNQEFTRKYERNKHEGKCKKKSMNKN